MRVEFLGTGGYHPNERRHTTCVFLPELGIALDAGTGMFRVPARAQTADLHILLSHAHLDHIVGLTYLLVPMATGAIQNAAVHASKSVWDAVRTNLFAEPIFPLMPPFQFHELGRDPSELPGGGALAHRALQHPGGSTGYRIDWPDRSLAFITDTMVDGSYSDFVRGVDLLIHECYFPDDMAEWATKTGHSHTTPVAELARDANVGRLLLMHIDPRRTEADPIAIDRARSIFPRTELAEDLTTINF